MHSDFLRSFQSWALVGTIVAACCSGVSAGADAVIDHDFEAGIPAGAGVVGTPVAITDGSDANTVLALTRGLEDQTSWVWFPEQLDIGGGHVEVEFDLFLGRAASPTPGDGFSVIFQFDGDLAATGGGAGGLGTANFRDGSPYIAVGFDLYDNGDGDAETPHDGRYGANSTCSVEVNQDNPAPHLGSQAFADAQPDFIASADVYGSPDQAARPGGSFDRADLVRVRIVFDRGLLQVALSGGWTGDDAGGAGEPFGERIVLSYTAAPFPNRPANIGFAATTGRGNAWQWIDNLHVVERESIVAFVPQPPSAAGAMNCGGGEVDTAGELDLLFAADVELDTEVSREGNLDDGLVVTLASFGRVPQLGDYVATNPRVLDLNPVVGAGRAAEELFATNAASASSVAYRGRVEPGRYEVKLYFAAHDRDALMDSGQSGQIFDAFLGDERVLCNWSPASAAGSPTGSGLYAERCTARLDTGIVRTFSADVTAIDGAADGHLDIVLADLGNGVPPGDPSLSALSYRRIGDATGQPADGDLECVGQDPVQEPPGDLLVADFDDEVDGACPLGMVCNSTGALPRVADGRLRIADDAIDNTAATAIFARTVDVGRAALRAEFDLFMANPGGPAPGDGGAFFVKAGSDVTAIGATHAGLGVPTGTYGFAVEFDAWDNGAEVNDPSGLNSAEQAWTHVGVNALGFASIATNADFDPSLRPVANGGTGWPDFFDPRGVHVTVAYDAGLVEVWLEGTTAEGAPFDALVLRASVPPIFATESVVGFSASTGGVTQHLEIDDVIVEARRGRVDDFVSQALENAVESWNGGQGSLYINCGGPLLACSAGEHPAPGASGHETTGEPVAWLEDLAGGGSLDPAVGELFSVVPLAGTGAAGLHVQPRTDMGHWNARGTDPGVDDNDRIFHSERYGNARYDIPVENGTYEVSLYFANSYSGTAGNARRVFHVDVEGTRRNGFAHCPSAGRTPLGEPVPNPFFGFDALFDPVDQAEALYSVDPCNRAPCDSSGVESLDDPDADGVPANEECGNAAAVCLTYRVTVGDGILSIALTEPDVDAGEPASPNPDPKISGIAVRRTEDAGPWFVRGDTDSSGAIQLNDGIMTLSWLFLGFDPPPCLDAADADDDGRVQLNDAVLTFNWLFSGGPAPAPPSPSTGDYPPEECNEDPSDDALGCERVAGKCG